MSSIVENITKNKLEKFLLREELIIIHLIDYY